MERHSAQVRLTHRAQSVEACAACAAASIPRILPQLRSSAA
jgi:hypothetical protein